MFKDLQILTTSLLDAFTEHFPKDMENVLNTLHEAEITTDSFSFYTSVSSVYSSKIEGEDIELDSYIKHKKYGISFLPDYTKKIDDLYNAYILVKSNTLNKDNIAHVHTILSKHILATELQGKLRRQNMFITTPDGRMEYVAANPIQVSVEMDKLYHDIILLTQNELSIPQAFYFASLVHLVFVKIHPWNDGNGRSARLIEKWFLAQTLGEKAWFMQSEKNYYEQHQTYYHNIRMLGLEYAELDYTQSLPFLLMLPNSLFNGVS